MLETAKLEVRGLGGSYGSETLTIFAMRPEMGPPEERSEEWSESDRSWALELRAWIEAVHGEHSVGATIDDAAAALELAGAAYAGAASR